MTAKEAMMTIQAIPEKIWNQLSEAEHEALEIAFSSMNCLGQYRWERDMAIETLEEIGLSLGSKTDHIREARDKQIAIRPIKAFDDKVKAHWCSCPVCFKGLGWEYGEARHMKYCPECGQKLDWTTT